MNLTTRIEAWANGRADCMAREATDGGSSRWAEDIQSYDDEATALLVDATALIVAAEALAGLDLSMWSDTATGFTCTEADAVADLLRVIHGDDAAQTFLVTHAEGDIEEGDLHTHLLEVAR